MIDDWRIDDGKLEERKLCLGCFASRNITLDKSVYEFSHWFVKEGKLDPYLPTEENGLLQKEVEEFAGDYFKMACDAILKGYDEWKK
jgi:hypothetical protein|tara:strand:+ start:212 stop:472 length:261 start_codon:yes stop_codon:yes gene_type:complete